MISELVYQDNATANRCVVAVCLVDVILTADAAVAALHMNVMKSYYPP